MDYPESPPPAPHAEPVQARHAEPVEAPHAEPVEAEPRQPTITPGRAIRHEALVLKLEALLHELRPLALRHPEAAVPAPLATLAEALLFDARPFTAPRLREPLPAAAPDFGGLVVQLGQAVATLDAFEVRHTMWSPELKAYAWRVGGKTDRPIARLRPRLARPTATERRESDRRLQEVLRMIEAKEVEAYDRGLAEGRAGGNAPAPAAEWRDRLRSR